MEKDPIKLDILETPLHYENEQKEHNIHGREEKTHFLLSPPNNNHVQRKTEVSTPNKYMKASPKPEVQKL